MADESACTPGSVLLQRRSSSDLLVCPHLAAEYAAWDFSGTFRRGREPGLDDGEAGALPGPPLTLPRSEVGRRTESGAEAEGPAAGLPRGFRSWHMLGLRSASMARYSQVF
ncbi:hypothetical protein GCM10022420_071150 [Streptomyces iranensis]